MMKNPNQTAENRARAGTKNVAGHQQNSTERGLQIATWCVLWVARWGYISGPLLGDLVLSRFGVKRPRIASELVKKGLLETVDVPLDERENLDGMRKVYRVKKNVIAWPGRLLKTDEAVETIQKMKCFYRPEPPRCATLEHLLTIQKHIIKYTQVNPMMRDWLSESECWYQAKKRPAGKQLPIPDCVVKTESDDEYWIEVETTSKRGERRSLMVSQYKNLIKGEAGYGLLGGKVRKILIFVPSRKVAMSYRKDGFGANKMQPIERVKKDIKPSGYQPDDIAWPIKPKDIFADIVEIWFPDDEGGFEKFDIPKTPTALAVF